MKLKLKGSAWLNCQQEKHTTRILPRICDIIAAEKVSWYFLTKLKYKCLLRIFKNYLKSTRFYIKIAVWCFKHFLIKLFMALSLFMWVFKNAYSLRWVKLSFSISNWPLARQARPAIRGSMAEQDIEVYPTPKNRFSMGLIIL